jgi:nucleotide-binding universal stress UspA family protein
LLWSTISYTDGGEKTKVARLRADSQNPRKHAVKTAPKKSRTDRSPRQGFSRIIVPTDFSRNAAQGVNYAVALAHQAGAKVALLHVIDWPIIPAELGAFMIDEDKAVGLAQSRLRKLAQLNVPDALLERTAVRIGRPHQEIARSAQSLKADLIVISSHSGGLKRTMLGSTAERVVRHAPCPVLTVKPGVGGKTPKRTSRSLASRINRILVPVDFSEASKAAVAFAVNLARMMRAGITLLYVAEPLAVGVFSRFPDELARHGSRAKQEAREKLEALAASTGDGIKIGVLVRQDVPHRGIVETAREQRSDLIVLPTRGLTGLKHIVLGSTAERVVRHASCPVLVVR